MADSKPKCDAIAKDVRESVTKEPAKVLMIVEDALVINEGCACEIVKTAIQASHADAAMVKQIVQTAVAVAPKMAPVIMECSGSVQKAEEAAPETVAKTTTSGKDAKNVMPAVVPPKDDGESDYGHGGGDIRGIYLMQPAVGGPGVPVKTPPPPTENTPRKPRGPRQPSNPPMSPSCSCVQ